jgi:hypothetical protein
MLKQRSRSSWEYPLKVRDAMKILQAQAQKVERIEPITSTQLVMT